MAADILVHISVYCTINREGFFVVCLFFSQRLPLIHLIVLCLLRLHGNCMLIFPTETAVHH